MPGAPFVPTRLNDLWKDVSLSGPAQGDLVYFGASGKLNNLAAGTSGKPLVTGGTGANPSWGGVLIGTNSIAATVPESGAGNSLTLSGSAAADGNNNGGNVVLKSGAKSGSGSDGLVQIKNSSGAVVCYFSADSPTYPLMVLGRHKIHSYDNPNIMLFGSTASAIFSINFDYFSGIGVKTSSFIGWCGDSTNAIGGLVAGFSSPGTNQISIYGTSGTPPTFQSYAATGTNTAGIPLNIAGGKGTGSGTPGVVNIKVSLAGASGTTLQSLVNIATFSATTQHFLITNQADVIGQKIQLYATQTVDALQITQSDGTTVVYKVNKDGNPTAKSTYFFEDANGYISRTSAGNTMSFSPSGAASVLDLTAQYLTLKVANAMRLRADTDSTDGEICTSNKGGNSGTGLGLLLHGGNGSTSGTPTAGGYAKLYGGDGAAGNTNGGAAYVFGGAKYGSGLDGDTIFGYTGSAARGNIALFGAGSFGGGDNVMFMATATTAPTSNPTGGFVFYVDPGDGAYKCRGPSGTITTLGVP